ncbi:glutaredoxin family protein [Streptomyces sp. NPDC050418]|uniref:glutaredoxin family protein n=1 Tax=Streptomyces sp. NPDC050418 TaxID=3365612 RepID=UPI0037B5B7D5
MSPLFRRSPRKNPAQSTVTLIGKPGCHLCEVAAEVVRGVCAETGASLVMEDITQDAELRRKYWEQIPVVLVDGEQHDFWKVDPDRLRRALGVA